MSSPPPHSQTICGMLSSSAPQFVSVVLDKEVLLKPHRTLWNLPVTRRELIGSGLSAALLCSSAVKEALASDIREGETLYNGIQLPPEWPPRATAPTFEPMSVPYLTAPPAVIPIDVGRQLFVDDFLIEETTLRRTFHQAEYHPACPILRPDRHWEKAVGNPTAMVFSDGVRYDPEEKLFKMWYMGGYNTSTCYATSRDGITWEKPSLDVRPGTNIVEPGRRDSCTAWLDLQEPDPKRRYKLFAVADRDRKSVV